MRMKLDLLEYGPEFPDKYDPSDFSFWALVNTNWPMAVEYELEQQGTAVITIKVMGAPIFIQNLTGEGMGQRRSARFTLPAYPGKGPHPALITFKATRPGRYGDERADFILHGAGAGDEAVASWPREPAGVEVAALGSLSLGVGRPAVAPPGHQFRSSLGIYDVTFGPKQGGVGYVYSFKVTGKFTRWGADITRPWLNRGRTEPETIKRATFRDDPINPRRPVSAEWNGRGKNEKRVRPGSYSVRVKAWVSPDGDWVEREGWSNSLTIN